PAGRGRLWRPALPAAPAAHPHAAGSPRTGTPPTPGRLRPVPAPPPPPPPPTPAATVDAATTTLDVSLAAAHHPTCLPPRDLVFPRLIIGLRRRGRGLRHRSRHHQPSASSKIAFCSSLAPPPGHPP